VRKLVILFSVLIVLPSMVVGAVMLSPGGSSRFDRLLLSLSSWGFRNGDEETQLFRYTDKSGRVVYVSSVDAVPAEYRDGAEVDPNLPVINRGAYFIPPTVTPTPVKPKRGGDGVINSSGKRCGRSAPRSEGGADNTPSVISSILSQMGTFER
jgi:hypothetical protein